MTTTKVEDHSVLELPDGRRLVGQTVGFEVSVPKSDTSNDEPPNPLTSELLRNTLSESFSTIGFTKLHQHEQTLLTDLLVCETFIEMCGFEIRGDGTQTRAQMQAVLTPVAEAVRRFALAHDTPEHEQENQILLQFAIGLEQMIATLRGASSVLKTMIDRSLEELWTDEMNALVRPQGWTIVRLHDDPALIEIQRLDDTSKGHLVWSSDERAVDFVRACAENGSRLCKTAYKLHQSAARMVGDARHGLAQMRLESLNRN